MGIHTAFIQGNIARNQELSREIEAAFGQLSEHQLNWLPGYKKWSIAQCLEHIRLLNGKYMQAAEKTLKKGQADETLADLPFHPSLLGKLLDKTMGPERLIKVPTFRIFTPDQKTFSCEIVPAVCQQLNTLNRLMQESEAFDINGLRVTSPATSLVVVKLGDVFTFLTRHTDRHIQQAIEVKEHPHFPHQ